jgi:hypothetical protein
MRKRILKCSLPNRGARVGMLPARSTILRDRRLTKRARFRAGRSGSLGASASVGALLRRARPSETARSRLPYGFASAAVWGWRKPCAQRATLEAFSVEAWSKPRSERTLVTVLTKPNRGGSNVLYVNDTMAHCLRHLQSAGNASWPLYCPARYV